MSGDSSVTVAGTDFTLSEALFGKPHLAGHGHWHLNVDPTTGPMMGMMTVMVMAGTETFQASTAGIEPGPRTFFAMLVGNGHTPFDPPVMTQVDLVVRCSAAASDRRPRGHDRGEALAPVLVAHSEPPGKVRATRSGSGAPWWPVPGRWR